MCSKSPKALGIMAEPGMSKLGPFCLKLPTAERNMEKVQKCPKLWKLQMLTHSQKQLYNTGKCHPSHLPLRFNYTSQSWRTDYASHIIYTFFVSVENQRPVILLLSAHPIMVTNRSHQIIILLITLNNASRYKLPH